MVKIGLNTGDREYVDKHGDMDYPPEARLVGFEIEEALVPHRTSH